MDSTARASPRLRGARRRALTRGSWGRASRRALRARGARRRRRSRAWRCSTTGTATSWFIVKGTIGCDGMIGVARRSARGSTREGERHHRAVVDDARGQHRDHRGEGSRADGSPATSAGGRASSASSRRAVGGAPRVLYFPGCSACSRPESGRSSPLSRGRSAGQLGLLVNRALHVGSGADDSLEGMPVLMQRFVRQPVRPSRPSRAFFCVCQKAWARMSLPEHARAHAFKLVIVGAEGGAYARSSVKVSAAFGRVRTERGGPRLEVGRLTAGIRRSR